VSTGFSDVIVCGGPLNELKPAGDTLSENALAAA
jgi:hypothetical protein